MKKCILWMFTLLLVKMCVLPLWNSAQAASGKNVNILDSGVRIVLPAGTSVETEQERKATYSAPYGVFDVTVDITKWALKGSGDFEGYRIRYSGIDMYVEENAANHCAVTFNGRNASYTVNFVDLHGNARSLMYDVFGISGPGDDFTDTTDPVLADLNYTVYDGYVKITKYSGKASEVEIPAEIEGKPVTHIGFCAFAECKSLVNVKIPEGVTTIENSVFARCSNLKSITLPETLTSIDSSVFINCVSLSSITIPDSVTSIGNGAFRNCESLTSIKLPAGLTRIGSEVFYNCNKLPSIKLPDRVTEIDWFAFSYCENLTSIEIPAGVPAINSYAFCECRNLTRIKIPDSVTRIYDHAFYYCKNLTNIKLPDGVTSIGESAFERCENLTSVSIPAGVMSIGKSAFYGCKGLKSIYFYGCDDIAIANNAIPGSATIYCYRNSAVDSWATANGYKVVYLDDALDDYDIYDALLVMQYVAGWDVSLDLDHADVDASGSVDIQDALLILRYVSGEDVELR